jgi:glycosyltransferase involved in cell wall biosynthesis
MHVLFLPSWYATDDKPWRGTFVTDQAHAAAQVGAKVGLAFVERRSLSNLSARELGRSHFQISVSDNGFRTMRMKGWSLFAQTIAGSLLWTRLMRALVRRYVREFGKPDVIHGHAALWAGYAALGAASDVGCRCVVTEHSSFLLMDRVSDGELRFASSVYRNADSVVAVGSALAERVNELAGRPVATIVPNTVDTDYFHLPPPERNARPDFTFIAVCDLVDYKRVDLLLAAFARLHVIQPRTRLVIVGTGGQLRSLQRLAADLHVFDAVEFTGALPRPQVRERLWSADALVLPSHAETFGVVLIEALSTGLPVVATRCGGPEDFVTATDGILVQRDDENALADAMLSTMKRGGSSRVRHESVKERFGFAAVGRRLEEVYESAASDRFSARAQSKTTLESPRARIRPAPQRQR